jgi:hypothetical protein
MAADEGCEADRIQVGGQPASNPPADYTLWHSEACHSAWAEYDSSADAFGRLEILDWIDEYGGANGNYQIDIGTAGNYPTPMVSWDDSVRVCVDTFNTCTGWR